jgi:hypothetical protein
MSISALSVFNVANRHTFSLIFQRDLESRRGADRAPARQHRARW